MFSLNTAGVMDELTGNTVTIYSYAHMSADEARTYKPKIVTLDEKNNIIKITGGDDVE